MLGTCPCFPKRSCVRSVLPSSPAPLTSTGILRRVRTTIIYVDIPCSHWNVHPDSAERMHKCEVCYRPGPRLLLPLISVRHSNADRTSLARICSLDTRRPATACTSTSRSSSTRSLIPPERRSRSRRKSCAPCAESKIKCDLAFPCDRCVTRGKECVAAAPKKARRSTVNDTPPSDGPSSSPNSLPPKSEDNSDDLGRTSYFQTNQDWRSQYGGETASGVTESARVSPSECHSS